jgi:hypothetical protein
VDCRVFPRFSLLFPDIPRYSLIMKKNKKPNAHESVLAPGSPPRRDQNSQSRFIGTALHVPHSGDWSVLEGFGGFWSFLEGDMRTQFKVHPSSPRLRRDFPPSPRLRPDERSIRLRKASTRRAVQGPKSTVGSIRLRPTTARHGTIRLRRGKGAMTAVADRPLHVEYENYQTKPIVIFRFADEYRCSSRFQGSREKNEANYWVNAEGRTQNAE